MRRRSFVNETGYSVTQVWQPVNERFQAGALPFGGAQSVTLNRAAAKSLPLDREMLRSTLSMKTCYHTETAPILDDLDQIRSCATIADTQIPFHKRIHTREMPQ